MTTSSRFPGAWKKIKRNEIDDDQKSQRGLVAFSAFSRAEKE